MVHLSWVLKHIMCMHYFKEVVSTYILIPAYHMHNKHGKGCMIISAGGRLSWRNQT